MALTKEKLKELFSAGEFDQYLPDPVVTWASITGKPTSMPASDVYAWAKAATKPSYTHTEVGAAATDHGIHVPTPQTANNAIYLRNDNTWQTITPAKIGAPGTTGSGASGTWGISITGNAATASDSSKLGGLSLGNATQGSHPGANAVVRTDGSGYINCGWINTVSGTASGTPTRIYCSQDAYLRYYAPDNATLRRSMKAYITAGTAAPTGGSDGDIYIQYW